MNIDFSKTSVVLSSFDILIRVCFRQHSNTGMKKIIFYGIFIYLIIENVIIVIFH